MAANEAYTAGTISVGQVLQLLDGPFAAFAEGVGKKQYAFWLGSGISRNRVADLKGLVDKVFTFLQKNSDNSNAACRYKAAITKAIALAELSDEERAKLDLNIPFSEWAIRTQVLDRVAGKYSRLLDISIDGEPDDFLLWNVVDVARTYSLANTVPDSEHLCIALLIIEGAVSELATANWDGLIEAAVDQLTAKSGEVLRTCVIAADQQRPPLLATLRKFHGCAVRAGEDEATYRPLLIGRNSQVDNWMHNAAFAFMRQGLELLCAERPTLMMGMSAQDVNIRQLFNSATNLMTWTWPSNPPAHVFAEDAIGEFQTQILRTVYRNAYTPNAQAISDSAHFRSFAKPLLLGLCLHVLGQKLTALASAVYAPNLSDADKQSLGTGAMQFRDQVANSVGSEVVETTQKLIRVVSRVLGEFREGMPDAHSAGVYRPISNASPHASATDPSVATNGLRELSAAIGLLGVGESHGHWTVKVVDLDANETGALIIQSAHGQASLYLVANPEVALRLSLSSSLDMDREDVVVVYSSGPAEAMARTPTSAPGRTGRSTARNVAMSKILAESTGSDDLMSRFREQAIV